MGTEYTFYDYIDELGNNIIKDWLNGEARDANMYFANIIEMLESSSPPRANNSFWKRPYAARLKGNWDGFWELRKKAERIQYRLLGQMQHRNVYLVTFGTHMGKYETEVQPQTAKMRVLQMINSPARYRREHEH